MAGRGGFDDLTDNRGVVDPSDPPAKTCDAVITAVRVFARGRRGGGGASPERDSPSKVKRRYGQEVLVFDTETLGDPAQRLLVGVWQLYLDPPGKEPGVTCTEEGFFYPDDLPARDPAGFATLEAYVRDPKNLADTASGFARRLKLWPLSRWIEERLWRCGWFHRRWSHVVGFNLPFDIGRVCPYWSPARGYFLGGWSLGLSGWFDRRGKWHDRRHARRLLMRAIDPRRTLFAWGKSGRGEEDEPEFWQPEAPFVDLHTLVFALTDDNHDLVRACAAFGDQWSKVDVAYGRITKRLLRYAREDVRHTAVLYRNCVAELRGHEDVSLVPYALYSPATVGTEYLRAMGVQPPMEKFDLDERIYGWSMAAFFGGRAEARIVRTPVPVTLVDAASMYPTVNALLGTWRFMVADRIDAIDVSDEVRGLLADPLMVDRCFDRSFWQDEIGVTLVELAGANEDILPVRAYWDPDAQDPGIGVNPLRYRGTLWYMLPDVIASVALSERVPDVARAIRLVPSGIQPGLRAVKLRGGPMIDPATEATDPFVTMVQQRRRVEADEALPKDERERLGKFLKITANATAYGILARFDRRDRSGTVSVFGPEEGPTKQPVSAVETPGPYCFPPVAAALTAAARLMLALLEREVTRASGTYAFCDTDSLAIVATQRGGRVLCPNADGGSVKALSRREIETVLARFYDLNPYKRSLVPTLWEEKHGSFDEPVTCFAISAKRYALFRETEGRITFERVVDRHDDSAASDDEAPVADLDERLEDWSEHGLGLYLDPRNPDAPLRDEHHRRIWMREAWEWIVRDDPRAPMPDWAPRLALTRFTVSSPKLRAWFSGFDDSVPASHRIRPGAFGLLGHPLGLITGTSQARPARSYERDPSSWEQGSWYDRRTGAEIAVTTLSPAEDPEGFSSVLASGAVRLQTLADVLTRYRLHPEHKSLAPDGTWSDEETRGLVRRRLVSSAPVLTDLIGKEGNKIIERLTGEVDDAAEYRTDYGARADRWRFLAVPVLRTTQREIGSVELAKRIGVNRRSVERSLRHDTPVIPHASTRIRYLEAALAWIAPRLLDGGIAPGRDSYGALWCYSREMAVVPHRVCEVCGRPVLHPLAKYCGAACKKRAYRIRANS